jgi:hypothetical protein
MRQVFDVLSKLFNRSRLDQPIIRLESKMATYLIRLLGLDGFEAKLDADKIDMGKRGREKPRSSVV